MRELPNHAYRNPLMAIEAIRFSFILIAECIFAALIGRVLIFRHPNILGNMRPWISIDYLPMVVVRKHRTDDPVGFVLLSYQFCNRLN